VFAVSTGFSEPSGVRRFDRRSYQLPATLQQALKAAQQQLAQQAQQAVDAAMKQQAPVAGVDVGFREAHWVTVN
jgi:predicted nucleic acid-binding Zn ribbon protein